MGKIQKEKSAQVHKFGSSQIRKFESSNEQTMQKLTGNQKTEDSKK